jgi:PAS domain S-box-containing protein
MLQSISDPMSMMDEDLTIIWANEAAKQYFGNNITGRKCYDVYHQRAEPCEPYPCLTLKAFHDGKMHRHETKVIDKGGEERFFECTANVALRDQSGKPVAVLEISRDITKRKKAEYALIESEATARALINAPTDSILLLDTQGVILDLNETAVQKLGKRREDLIGTCADDALPGDVAKARRARISRVIETKKPVRFVDERDGFWFDTVAYPIKNEHGEVVRLAVIARDINDLMQAEETLRETVSAFRMLAENSPDIIVRMAPDGTCHYISPAVSAILGYRPEEITGTSVFRYLHPDDLEHIRETIADFNRNSRETSTDTFRIRHQHGHYVRFETTTRAIRDPVTGKVKEFYTVSRDISARTGT